MDNILISLAGILCFALVVGFVLAEVMASGRLGPRYRLTRDVADMAKAVLVALFLPLAQILFLVAPHGWAAGDWRNSFGFRMVTTAVIGALELGAVIGAVRAVRRRRGG